MSRLVSRKAQPLPVRPGARSACATESAHPRPAALRKGAADGPRGGGHLHRQNEGCSNQEAENTARPDRRAGGLELFGMSALLAEEWTHPTPSRRDGCSRERALLTAPLVFGPASPRWANRARQVKWAADRSPAIAHSFTRTIAHYAAWRELDAGRRALARGRQGPAPFLSRKFAHKFWPTFPPPQPSLFCRLASLLEGGFGEASEMRRIAITKTVIPAMPGGPGAQERAEAALFILSISFFFS